MGLFESVIVELMSLSVLFALFNGQGRKVRVLVRVLVLCVGFVVESLQCTIIVRRLCISLHYMWGSAFAVCIMQSSLTCQFEHSGKVRSGLVKIWLWKICFSLLPGSASFNIFYVLR